MTKSVKLLAVMLGSFAVTMFLFRHDNADPANWVFVLLIMLVIYLSFGVPAVRAFIVARPKAVFRAGVGLALSGFVGIFVLAFTSAFYRIPAGITGKDAVSLAVMGSMMTGIALAVLPRSLAALKRTEQAAPVPVSPRTSENSFDGVREGWAAVIWVMRNGTSFARLIGPWIVLLWVVPLVGLHIAGALTGNAGNFFAAPIGKVSTATVLLAERLPYTVASAIAFPVALVAWHRYIITGAARSFAPFGAIARYLWRLWMLGFMLSLVAKLVSANVPDLSHFLGTADKQLVTEILYWALLIIGGYLGGSVALVLPAVAMGERDFTASDSLRVTKPLGSSFGLGFVLSFLPFGALWWVGIVMLRRIAIMGPSSPLTQYALWLLPLAAMFLALASCATYLSRAYNLRLTEVTRTNPQSA